MATKGYLGARGKLINEKKPEISANFRKGLSWILRGPAAPGGNWFMKISYQAPFHVPWGLYRVMYRSSFGLIRPLQDYIVYPLFPESSYFSSPMNVSEFSRSDLAFMGLQIIWRVIRKDLYGVFEADSNDIWKVRRWCARKGEAKCSGSMTFWCGCLWLMDPDPDPVFGSCYFRHWPSRCQQKTFFYKFRWLLLFEGTFASFFKEEESKRSNRPVGIKVFLAISACW